MFNYDVITFSPAPPIHVGQQDPGFIQADLVTAGIQWIKELVYCPPGVVIEGLSPGTLGSSGTTVNTSSRASLKSAILQFLISLILLGIELNN